MSKNIICFNIIIICFTIFSNCFAAVSDDLPYDTGSLLVKFAPKTDGRQKTTNERNQILSSLNAGEVKHSFRRIPGLTLVKLPAKPDFGLI